MSATRLLVKLSNRDQPLVFGATSLALDCGQLSITLWEPANDVLVRTVEIKADGWDWYEWQAEAGEPPDPRGRIENSAKTEWVTWEIARDLCLLAVKDQRAWVAAESRDCGCSLRILAHETAEAIRDRALPPEVEG